MNRTRAYWMCQIGGWTVYVLSRIGLSAFFQETTWERVGLNLILGGAGLLYTHLYRMIIHRRRWTRMSIQQLAPRVILASVFIAALIHFTIDPIGRYLLELDFYEEVNSELGLLLASVANGAILIMLWSLIYFGVHAIWNHRQAEVDRWKMKAKMEATKLRALKLQLNPHFLFNSLNSVRALIDEDPPRAQRAVTKLAGLLRATLRSGDTSIVPLEEELRTVKTYLDLEAMRLEERLQYQIEVPEALRSRPVPFLLVQTLVENGIKHGVARRPDGGHISISAHENGDRLCLRIDNTGQLDPGATSEGVGLQNARERLKLLFGDAASLRLGNVDDQTVRAEVVLPPEVDSDPTPEGSDSMPMPDHVALSAKSAVQ